MGVDLKWEAIKNQYKINDIIQAKIKANLGYGYRISINEEVEGFMHNNDRYWDRTKAKNATKLCIDDNITVMVLDHNNNNNTFTLGAKQCTPNPWIGLNDQLPEGTRLKGTVTEVIDYGCFVNVAEQIDGLVYVSDMDWVNHNMNPSHAVSVGDTIDVMVLDVNEKRERLQLGLKQCTPNPWEQFAQLHQKGDTIPCIISALLIIGIEVRFPSGITGIIHESDVIGDIRDYETGMLLNCTLSTIDIERERISLVMKP